MIRTGHNFYIDISTTAVATDSPVYALKLGDSPLHLISAADARRLTTTLAIDLKDSGIIPTFPTTEED